MLRSRGVGRGGRGIGEGQMYRNSVRIYPTKMLWMSGRGVGTVVRHIPHGDGIGAAHPPQCWTSWPAAAGSPILLDFN